MISTGPDYAIFRGDTLKITFEVTDKDDAPVNIADWVITMAAKKSVNDPGTGIVLSKVAIINNAPLGLASIDLLPGDTNLEAFNYVYDTEFKNAGSTIVKTYRGRLTICKNIVPN